MGRKAASFSAADVARAVKATVAAGLDVARVEVQPDGTIVVVTATAETTETGGLTDLEKWRARRGARPIEGN